MKFILLSTLLLASSFLFSQYEIDDPGSASTCSGTFYDSGGSGANYGNNQNLDYTICSNDPNKWIVVNFTAWNVENNFDVLTVYDGNSTAGSLIGSYSGNSPGTVTGTTGCLTFVFTSDGSVNGSGWAASISCINPPPSCCDGIKNQGETTADCGGPCPACVTSSCTVTATANPTTLPCGGGNVTLTAVGVAQQPAMDNDFDGGSVGTGWQTTPGAADFSNPCGPGPGGASSPHLWMGSGTTAPRQLRTEILHIPCGGTVCFDFRMAKDIITGNGANAVQHPDCEDPDEPDEGVYIQFSNNCGNTWTTLNYFEPKTNQSGPLYTWNNYCYTFPAPTNPEGNIVFQWYQSGSTTSLNDHWGLDNIIITPTPCAPYYYDWNVDGTTDPASIVDNITATTTWNVIYTNGIDDTCSASVTTTVNNSLTIDPIADQTVCDSYTLPTITGTNLTGNQTYYTGSGATGTQLAQGSTITTPGINNIYAYDIVGTCFYEEPFTITINLTPNITDPSDVTACDTYTLPAITGTNLTGNQAYYTGSGGTGTQLAAGSIITNPGINTFYLYDQTATTPNCWDEETFSVTIVATPVITPLANQVACDSYTLPTISGTDLSGNQAYFTGPGGTGTQLSAGANITTPGVNTLYIYDQTGTTPNCFDEETFTVTINITPILDPVANQTACGTYTLPSISGTNLSGNQAYYTGPNATGSQLTAGSAITTVGANLIYIYDETATVPNCFDETSFTVTINLQPNAGIDNGATLCNVAGTTQDLNLLLDPAAEPGGVWTETTASGQFNTGTQIFDASGLTPGNYTITYMVSGTPPCVNDTAIFTITVTGTITAGADNSATLCNNTGTTLNLTTLLDPIAGAGGTWAETSATPSGQFNNTTAVLDASGLTPGNYTFTYTLAGSGSCPGDDALFTITVNGSPDITPVPDVSICDSYVLPAITGVNLTGNQSYYDAPGGTGNLITAGSAITAAGSTSLYLYDETGTVPNCFDEELLTVTINLTPIIDPIANSVVCDSYSLPAITGTNLTTNVNYYDLPNAGGNILTPGTNITTPGISTVYIFDSTGTTPNCIDEVSFTVSINITPDVNDLSDTTVCDNYTLPAITGNNLTGNQAYYTGPGGTGTAYGAGQVITSAGSNTFYIYDETGTTPNCFDEESFTVTINLTPVIDPLADQVACGSYTMPVISGTNLSGNQSYFDGPQGTGNTIAEGSNITALGINTIYVYDETGSVPNCWSEDTLTVTINFTPVIDPVSDITACDTYSLPTITGTNLSGNQNYYTGSQMTGSPLTEGSSLTSPGINTIYVYDETGTNPNCFTEDTILITINLSPNAGLDATQTLCNTAGTTFDLNTILDPLADAGGTWSETTGTPSGQFDPNTAVLDAGGLNTGNYIFIYVVNGTAPCVNDTAVFTVTITGVINAGADNVSSLCNSSGTSIQLNTLLDPTADAGGIWAETTAVPSGQFNTTTTGFDATGLTAGDYTFTYTLAASGSCPGDQALFTITIYPTPQITPQADVTICDNYILPQISGTNLSGNQNYYDAPNGTGNLLTQGSNINASGANTIYVYDESGTNPNCMSTDTFVVTINITPVIDPMSDVTFCDNYTLPAFTGTNLTPGASYYDGPNGTGNSITTGTIISNPGTNTIFVYDETATTPNCFNEISFDVNIVQTPAANAGADDTICSSLSYNMSAVPSLGTGTWTGPANISFSDINNPLAIATSALPGTFLLTWTEDNGNGCIDSDDVSITFSDLSFTDAIIPSNCGQNDGSITITASGGVGNYQYSNDSGLTYQSGGNFANLYQGTYNIVVLDEAACTSEGPVIIQDLNGPVINSSVSTDVTCNGDCNGSLSINASGANSFSIDNINYQASPSFTNLCAGVYILYAQNNAGCIVTKLDTINQPNPMNVVATTTPLTCANVCNGQISASATGGTGQYQYNVDFGVPQLSSTFTNLCAGQHVVTVTDIYGCFDTAHVNIAAPTPLNLIIQVVDASCFGMTNASITAIPSGGTPYPNGSYDFIWSNNVFTGYNAGIGVGSYNLHVTDYVGCTIDSNNIIVSGPPAVVIDAITTTGELCFGDCQGSITVAATNATQFKLNANGSWGTTTTFTNLCAGNYTVYARDGGACEVSAPAVITSMPPVTITASPDQIICIGGTATISAQAMGGTGSYSYNWIETNDNTQSINVSPTGNSTYTVTATDQNGCTSAPDEVTITLLPAIQVNAFLDASICEGESANISAIASGGNGGPYTYIWDQGVGSGANHTVNPTFTTTYTVSATDGCETPAAQASVTITVNPNPVPGFMADTLEGCYPVTINFSELNVPVGSTCFWSFGDGTTSSECSNVTHTFENVGCWDVSLTVTSPEGCTGNYALQDYICVYDYPVANFSFDPQPTSILQPTIEFTNLSINAVDYLWSFDNGSGFSNDNNIHPNFTFPDDQGGSYEVCLLAITEHGCTHNYCDTVIIADEFLIYVPNAFTPDNDGLNDIFLPVVHGHDELSYQLWIFDRWGQLIFTSQHASVGWDGTYKGLMSQQDAYVWKIYVEDKLEHRGHEYIGHVILLK